MIFVFCPSAFDFSYPFDETNNILVAILFVVAINRGADCGNFQCQGVLLVWKIVQQGPTVLTVLVDGGCLDGFVSHLSVGPCWTFFIPPAYEVCYGGIMFSSFLCVCVCLSVC